MEMGVNTSPEVVSEHSVFGLAAAHTPNQHASGYVDFFPNTHCEFMSSEIEIRALHSTVTLG